MSERTAPLEVRIAGRTLVGEAIRYREQSRDRAELFEPGSLQPVYPVTLNLQHDPERRIATTEDGTLRLSDSPEALRIEADLREGSAELALVRRGALTGLSIEFHAISERRNAGGLRVLDRAALPAIGLVDRGSYRTVGRVAPSSRNPQRRVEGADGPQHRSADPDRAAAGVRMLRAGLPVR